MLYALPVSLFAMSVAASELPEMSRAGDPTLLVSRCHSALRRTSFFVTFAAVAYVVAGETIVGALFRWGAFDADDTRVVWLVLAAYSIGLPAIGASRIFQNTLYSIGDTKGPARIAATRVVVAGVVGVVFMFPMDHVSVVAGSLSGLENVFAGDGPHVEIPGALGAPHLGAVGLALGSAVAAWLELALLTRLGRRTVEGFPSALGTLRPLLPALAAATPVALILVTTTAGLPPQVSAPLVLAAAGLTYTVVAHLTGVAEAKLLFSRLVRTSRG